MRNHFHLVLETPEANLVAGMKWLLGVYTKRFNLQHKECGHLFAGRYKALHVESSGDGYLRTLCDYVQLNPARARLLKGGQPLAEFPWSSYGDYLRPAGQRPVWLRVDRLLGERGIPQDSAAGRREFARLTEQRRRADLAAEFKPVERGWCLGSEEFRQELLAAAAGSANKQSAGFAAGGNAALGMGCGSIAPGGQGGRAESPAGRADPQGNHHEPQMDRRTFGHGQLDPCFKSARRRATTRKFKK
jgi:hypothetical protein